MALTFEVLAAVLSAACIMSIHAFFYFGENYDFC